MGGIRRSVVILVVALLAAIAAAPGTASAATQCSDGWCYAPSTDFPNATGAYGIVWGGTNPQEPILDYINGQWTNLPGHVLAPGTPVYVAPFANGWRWVYTSHLDWCIIDADHLWLRWPS